MKAAIIKTIGKKTPKCGVAPAIILQRPKFARNVGACVRALACFGLDQLWYTGDRIQIDTSKGERFPREERMREYQAVQVYQYDRPFDMFERGVIPVAIELVPGAQSLPDFEHSENMIYVFGPEDGSLSSDFMRFCHHRVAIPIRHCSNLSAAVYMVLYDRQCKLQPGLRVEDVLAENRGFELPVEFGQEEG